MKKRRFTEKKSISSVFSLFLAFALMVTSVLGSSLGTLEVQAAKGTLSGSGTYDDPYIIEDAADLKAFAALLDGNADNLGICAKVADGVASIDVSDETWQPMPANVKDTKGNDAGYTGVFDGNGATINLNVDKSADRSGNNVGLFSIISNGGEVKNVTTDGSITGKQYVGGICGTNKGTISNCNNKADVNAGSNVAGGIAGCCESSGKIQFSGAMTNSGKINSSGSIGGIAGMCDRNQTASPIRAYGDIVNQGKISTTQADNIGGIVGSYNCKEGIVSDTGVIKNEGAIEGIGTYVGGIVGSYNIKASTGAVKKCINTGDVTASKGIQVGGLFGYVSITSSTEEYRNIENSYSTGQVNVTDATDATDSRNGTLVGCFSGNKIKNCYDTVTDALPMLGTTKYCQGVENCYSMSEDTSVTEPEGVVVKTKAEFASGEVAYLLDGTGENRAEAPVWGQNIGTDESPVLGGAAVYKDGDVYANTEHTYDVAYTWSADKKNCTAKQNCRLCGIEGAKETVAAAYSIKKQATEQAEGIGLYTAVFKNGLFTTQTAEVKIAKLTPKPSQPTNPSNPSNPTKPTKPSDPSKPTNPSNPTKPTNNKKKPAAKGTTLKDSKGATYKVTGAKVKNPTVTYVKPKKNVKKVSIPATITVKGVKYQVTAVSKDAFKNNKKVTQVTIDKNVKNIGKNAFYGCKNLKKVIIKTTKLTKKTVGKNAFKGIHKKATIKVPKKKLNAYKKLLKNAGISKSVKVVKM